MSKSTSQLSYPLIVDGTNVYFVTEQRVYYYLYLTEGADYLPKAPFSHLIQMFGFQKQPSVPQRGIDGRVRNTIISCIRIYFDQNPDLILAYVCDMMDGKQKSRNHLFNRWHTEFGHEYCKLDYTDGLTTYCGLLFRPDHTYRDAFEESVNHYIQQKGG